MLTTKQTLELVFGAEDPAVGLEAQLKVLPKGRKAGPEFNFVFNTVLKND